MRFLLGVALLLGIPQSAEERDLDALAGRWRIVSWETSGVGRSRNDIDMTRTLIFDGARYTWEGDEWWGTMALDPRSTPKRVDYTLPHPRMRGARYLGIYEIDGPRFRDCFAKPGQPRPVSFGTTAGDGITCVEYEREKGVPAT